MDIKRKRTHKKKPETFTPLNALEETLMAAASDPSFRLEFYKDLLESELYLVHFGHPQGEGDSADSEAEYQLEIQQVEFEGEPYIPVYSALERLEENLPEGGSYLSLSARELFENTAGAQLLLNPGSQYGKAFSAEEIESILDGTVWNEVLFSFFTGSDPEPEAPPPKEKITTVEQYINSFAPATRALLRELRATIISAAPNATERINYQLPTYSLNGDLVHFGAFTRHIGFYPSPGAITAFANELSGYKTSKGAVQFPLNRPLPLELVEKMVRFRVKENTEKTKRK